MAPKARFEARFEDPSLVFSGSAYHDGNEGDEPLEATLERWEWARFETPRGCLVLYDVIRRDKTQWNTAYVFCANGSMETQECSFVHVLPRTFVWAFPRRIRWWTKEAPRVVRTLEESPFYSRSLLRARFDGQDCWGVHESLSLSRFKTPWMQKMLPLRILDRKQ
jgi:carotenoid 1,2-hydratase